MGGVVGERRQDGEGGGTPERPGEQLAVDDVGSGFSSLAHAIELAEDYRQMIYAESRIATQERAE